MKFNIINIGLFGVKVQLKNLQRVNILNSVLVKVMTLLFLLFKANY